MNSFQNFLYFINENFTSLIVIIGLIIAIYKKSKDYFSKSNEEKIEIAKKQIREVVLRLITEAELDFEEWDQAGSIKRSQVIGEIFTKYPILSKSIDQESVIKWIDNEIDNSLKTLRDVIANNEE